MKQRGTHFYIDKTYLDGIDASGNGFIVYAACMKFLFFRVHYSACLKIDRDGNISEQAGFHKSILSEARGKLIFSNERLNIQGEWDSLQKPVETELYKNSTGRV
jgi:hypothetical protein